MKNQECYTKDGKYLGWFSRSVAVCAVIYIKEGMETWVLASQRGPGSADPELVGKWNLVCGYLDWDETTMEAVIREVKEETGVDISKEYIRLIAVKSNPKKDKRQNVTLRYGIVLSGKREDWEKQFSHAGNEPGEVGEIRFINTKDLKNYKWAFNHDQVIQESYLTTIYPYDEQ